MEDSFFRVVGEFVLFATDVSTEVKAKMTQPCACFLPQKIGNRLGMFAYIEELKVTYLNLRELLTAITCAVKHF